MRLYQISALVLFGLAVAAVHAEEFDEDVGEDAVMEEDEMDEGGVPEDVEEGVVPDEEEIEEAEEETDDSSSNEIDVQNYFPNSVISAGKVSELLVSFKVKDEALNEYVIGAIEGGFHYPQDWSYKVQNFSAIRYNRKLAAGEEATFMYPFMPAELAGGRSYGLQLNIHYHNDASPPQFFTEAVYNQTIEVEENMDNALMEQCFMFLTLCIFGSIGAAFFYRQTGFAKKKVAVVVETGTSGTVDESWIPKTHYKQTEKTSPKARKSPKSKKAD